VRALGFRMNRKAWPRSRNGFSLVELENLIRLLEAVQRSLFRQDADRARVRDLMGILKGQLVTLQRESKVSQKGKIQMSKWREEFIAEDVRLICADCREVIPTLLHVDAVVTDPPFGIQDIVHAYGRAGLQRDRRIINDRNLNVMIDAFNLIKNQFNNIWIVSFYSSRISPVFFRATEMLDYFGEVMWNKVNIGLGSQIRYQHENVAFFKIGKPLELGQISSVQSYMKLFRSGDKSVHPHEKPINLLSNLCGATPGKIILDPFMGTGTTGAAAVQLRRGFIGIEYDEKYFDIACKKISDAWAQPINFWEEYGSEATATKQGLPR
jgi:DNA modification methylase